MISKEVGKKVEKEFFIRVYGSSIDNLKAAVRQVAQLEGVTPTLYGKDNEYILKLDVISGGEAAATMLCESAAVIMENALGDEVYARGVSSLAHMAAGALITKSAQLCAASAELGELLAEEFQTTKRGDKIFDFGEATYNSKNAAKIKVSEKTVKQEGESSLAAASELAVKVCKVAKVRYGAAITPPDENGNRWIVVAEKSQTYVRQMQQNDSPRACALAVLDLVRRLAGSTQKSAPVPKRQLAVQEDEIIVIERQLEPSAHKSSILATIAVMVFCAILASGAFYCYDKFYIEQDAGTDVVQAYK